MRKNETNSLTWQLTGPGTGLLERAGIAALSMTLRAAEELRADLSPLQWSEADLTRQSVTIRSTDSLEAALTKLFSFAWQVRDRVLYLPAIHRDWEASENSFMRVCAHNGIMRTFLQHPRVQPKGDLVEQIINLDEDRQIKIAYQSLDSAKLKPITDLAKAGFFGRDGTLAEKDVSLSGWVFPGIAPRYGPEVAWSGPAKAGLLLMLAPIVCMYQQLHSERSTWLFVVPDVRDVEVFASVRLLPMFGLDPSYTDVASLGDAALRFLAEYTSDPARRDLEAGCRVVAMGKVGYYQSQSIRKGVADVNATAKICRRYRILNRVMMNRWMKRKPKSESAENAKARKRKNEQPTNEARDFTSVPTGRGRIADNLMAARPWYLDLFQPLPWDWAAVERQRKKQPGVSTERLWFYNLLYQRGQLMELIQEEEMWDNPEERLFVEAFWQVLAALYRREADAVERGGSRTFGDRIEDLNEDIRRCLTRAKTRPLLRQAIIDLFARPVEKYRSPVVRQRPDLVWHLIDDDWKRSRDLALLALASYQSKEKREAGLKTDEQTESPETEGVDA